MRAFWIILAIAAAVRLAAAMTLDGHPLLQPAGDLDTAVYVRLAQQVAGGDWLLRDGRAFYVSPLYLYFLALVFAGARDSAALLTARVVQAIVGAAAVALVRDTARRWLGGRAADIAALLAATCGVFVYYEVQILQAALDPALTALGAWLLTRAWLDGQPGWWFATGAALGLHALNRPNMLAWAVVAPLVAVVASAWARRARGDDGIVDEPRRTRRADTASRWGDLRRAVRGRRASAAPLLALLGAALVIAPVTVRNAIQTGEAMLITSHGGLNFYIGNHAGADGTYQIVPGITPSIAGQARDARAVASAALGRTVSDADASRYFAGEAFAWIRREPIAAVALFARKLAWTLNAIELSLNGSYAFLAHDETTVLTFLPVGPWLLLPLGLVGLWLGARVQPTQTRRAAWAAWIAFVPVYAAAVALFFVSGRYRLPILVPLTLAAAATLDIALTRIRLRRWAATAALGAAVLAAAVFTSWPTGLDDGRSGDRADVIVRRIDEGRTEEALALLARWEPAHPMRAQLLYRAGTALLERGDVLHARALLDRAVAVAPDHADLRRAAARVARDLGTALARQPSGRADAASALELAVRLDPDSETARLNLAVVYAETGRMDEARRQALEALRLRPGYDRARAFLAALDRAAGPR